MSVPEVQPVVFRTGKDAYVDGVPCTTSWSLNHGNTASSYEASCAPDASAASPGNIDFTGNMTGLGYLPPIPGRSGGTAGPPVLAPGEATFKGVTDGRTPPLLYSGIAMVGETTLNIPVAAGTPINWSANFGIQGGIEKSVSLGDLVADATRTVAPSAKHGAIWLTSAIGPTETDFGIMDGVQNITLVFRRDLVSYVRNGFTYRQLGNLFVDLSFDVLNHDILYPHYMPNTYWRCRVQVGPTYPDDCYELESIMMRDKSNYMVSRSERRIVGYTVNAMFTALRPQVTPVLGYIDNPLGDQIYPLDAPFVPVLATAEKEFATKRKKARKAKQPEPVVS